VQLLVEAILHREVGDERRATRGHEPEIGGGEVSAGLITPSIGQSDGNAKPAPAAVRASDAKDG
jgi:hypothetical protein